jgi:hypothetical protein
MDKSSLPWGKIILPIALIIGAILLFYNAGNYYLWGDEGVTAFYGKNIVKFGLPYGFDGRNLFEFRNGIYLNRIFLPLLDPWGQLYISAASLAIFGMNSFGARALFIIFGLAAVIIQYLFVKSYFRDERLALINVILMISSVMFILFARQSRYYSLGMFLTPVITYLYARFENRLIYLIISSIMFIAFFFTNSLIGMAVLSAMAISFYIFDDRKKALVFFLKPLPFLILAGGFFLLWLCSHGMPANPSFLRNIHPLDFGRIIWIYFTDYNETQLLPVGMLIILLLMWVRQGTFTDTKAFPQVRKEFSIISVIIIATAIISILSPQVSSAAHSDIRYATPLFPFLLLVQALVINRLFAWKKLVAVLLLVIVIGTNLLTFTPFRCYLYEYVKENVQPFDNSVKAAVQFLEKRIHQDDVILVSPNHMTGSMEFYLADRLLFCNIIGEDNKNLLASGVKLPEYIYSSDTIPDWIVLFGLSIDTPHTARHLAKLDLSQYKTFSFSILGQDVSRPELFWRSFVPITKFQPEQGLYILEHIKGKDSKK